MLKTHCVTNLRASTQRCACCVLELLRLEHEIDWDAVLLTAQDPKSSLTLFKSMMR